MEFCETVQWHGAIDSWDEAVPLGNGILGVLMWKGQGYIQMSLDRADLWDTRIPQAFLREDWCWEELVRLVSKKEWSTVRERFCEPGVAVPYPTKLPAGRLIVRLPHGCTVERFELDRDSAVGRAYWSGGSLECLCDASSSSILLTIEGVGVSYETQAPAYNRVESGTAANFKVRHDLNLLGYEEAVGVDYPGHFGFIQSTRQDGSYGVVGWSTIMRDVCRLRLTVQKADSPSEVMQKCLAELGPTSEQTWLDGRSAHIEKWREFWTASLVRVPDPQLDDHYRQSMYFLGSTMRLGAPPVALQAIWTADDGTLPPWKGDYHNNLNTQLTYWSYLTGNHQAMGEAFLDYMFELLPVHQTLAREFFGCDGAFVPGAMALDGKLIGGYAQVSYSPTNGVWIAHLFHVHWQYTRDREFLEKRTYPYCREIGTFILGILVQGDDGKLRLPLSASPEIHEGEPAGWVPANSNYDLSLMRWLFSALLEMSEELSLPSKEWARVVSMLDDLSVSNFPEGGPEDGGEGPLEIAPGKSLHESHRHHSHLMAIYPLGTLNVEQGTIERSIIEQSLRQIDRLGTGLWVGYSFAWMACIAARVGHSERARRCLSEFVNTFISKNGFHLNGDYKCRGVSWWNYRPFTLEGNFAFAQGIHEMLLQGWGGILRVFPAVPEDWRDVEFRELRAEGGLFVSARKKDGHICYLRVRVLNSVKVFVKDPFSSKGRWNYPLLEEREGRILFEIDASQPLIGSLIF